MGKKDPAPQSWGPVLWSLRLITEMQTARYPRCCPACPVVTAPRRQLRCLPEDLNG